jgi:hypothetical protein
LGGDHQPEVGACSVALTRRSFLRLLGLGAAGVAAIPCLPSLQAQKPPRPRLTDDQLGIAIRYVQQYDIQADRWPTRMNGYAIVPVDRFFNPRTEIPRQYAESIAARIPGQSWRGRA